jgi:hypothetical protein
VSSSRPGRSSLSSLRALLHAGTRRPPRWCTCGVRRRWIRPYIWLVDGQGAECSPASQALRKHRKPCETRLDTRLDTSSGGAPPARGSVPRARRIMAEDEMQVDVDVRSSHGCPSRCALVVCRCALTVLPLPRCSSRSTHSRSTLVLAMCRLRCAGGGPDRSGHGREGCGGGTKGGRQQARRSQEHA